MALLTNELEEEINIEVPNEELRHDESDTNTEEISMVENRDLNNNNARKAGKNLSKLLKDGKCRTRGGRMFRKRRRRSERFAIIGYGTQPVEEDKHPKSDSETDKSDSTVFSTSSGDDIPVYDKPGPGNVLEVDNKLNPSEKIVQRQLKGLAMEVVNMKGKGAKLFVRRQRRMEKFVVEASSDEGSNIPTKQNGAVQSIKTNNDRSSYTPVSFNNIHANCQTNELIETSQEFNQTSNSLQVHKKSNFASADWSTDEEGRNEIPGFNNISRPLSVAPKSPSRSIFKSVVPPSAATPKILLDKKPPTFAETPTVVLRRPKEIAENKSPKRCWSSVKFQPKKPSVRVTTQDRPSPMVNYPGSPSPQILTTASLNSPAQMWSPKPNQSNNNEVKSILQKSQQQSPFKTTSSYSTTKSSNIVKKESNEVIALEMPSKVSKQDTTSAPFDASKSPSLQLLNKPMIARTPSPIRSFDAIKTENQTTAHHSVNPSEVNINSLNKTSQADDSLTNEITQLKINDEQIIQSSTNGTLSPYNTTHGTDVDHQYKPVSPNPTPLPDNQQINQEKPKVAACLKLLDPAKGKYEPKTELVYKQTPNIGAKLDQVEPVPRSPSRTSYMPVQQQFNKPVVSQQQQFNRPVVQQQQQFNKPVVPQQQQFNKPVVQQQQQFNKPVVPQQQQFNKPVVQQQQQQFNRPISQQGHSYTPNSFGSRPPSRNSEKPVALGSIAGELKGKGARMFAKQQERMDKYTKECNGAKKPEINQSQMYSRFPNVKPEENTKTNMTSVLGEFKKVSNSNKPKRPSATKRGKSKDPFHYQQYYVVRRPPSSADFVEDTPSDSNTSATSSMTSFEASTTSSQGKGNEMEAEKGPPPRVAPKPKVRRFTSNESNPSTPILTDNVFEESKNVLDHFEGVKEVDIQNNTENEDHHKNGDQLITLVNKPDQIEQEAQEIANAPKYNVWKPGQPQQTTPQIDFSKFPQLPSYHEVTNPSNQASKLPYQPGTITNTSNVVNGNVAPKKFQSVLAPRPKFTASVKVPTKWQPGN